MSVHVYTSPLHECTLLPVPTYQPLSQGTPCVIILTLELIRNENTGFCASARPKVKNKTRNATYIVYAGGGREPANEAIIIPILI